MQTTPLLSTCHYCQEEKEINLRGQKFMSETKRVNYALCQSCCDQLNKISTSTSEDVKRRLAFWEKVFSQVETEVASRSH